MGLWLNFFLTHTDTYGGEYLEERCSPADYRRMTLNTVWSNTNSTHICLTTYHIRLWGSLGYDWFQSLPLHCSDMVVSWILLQVHQEQEQKILSSFPLTGLIHSWCIRPVFGQPLSLYGWVFANILFKKNMRLTLHNLGNDDIQPWGHIQCNQTDSVTDTQLFSVQLGHGVSR